MVKFKISNKISTPIVTKIVKSNIRNKILPESDLAKLNNFDRTPGIFFILKSLYNAIVYMKGKIIPKMIKMAT